MFEYWETAYRHACVSGIPFVQYDLILLLFSIFRHQASIWCFSEYITPKRGLVMKTGKVTSSSILSDILHPFSAVTSPWLLKNFSSWRWWYASTSRCCPAKLPISPLNFSAVFLEVVSALTDSTYLKFSFLTWISPICRIDFAPKSELLFYRRTFYWVLIYWVSYSFLAVPMGFSCALFHIVPFGFPLLFHCRPGVYMERYRFPTNISA